MLLRPVQSGKSDAFFTLTTLLVSGGRCSFGGITRMSTSSSSPSPQIGKSTRRTWLFVGGIVLFAALMALRYELSSVWVRAAVRVARAQLLAGQLWRHANHEHENLSELP